MKYRNFKILAAVVILTLSVNVKNVLADDTTTTDSNTNFTTVNLNLRYQNNLIFSGAVNIPDQTTITDDQNSVTTTNAKNVLTALIAADQASDQFSISDLQYFPSYGSYLVKCLSIASASSATCDNWNYVVNNSFPNVGMDGYALTGGENIYIFFGSPWKITTPSSSVFTNTTTTFNTWRYNYDNLDNEFVLDPNDQVSITQPNPNPTGWWDSNLTVYTTVSDANGLAYFSFSTTGTFGAQISANDFSKYSSPVSLTVVDAPVATSTDTSTTTTSTDNGGSGSGNTDVQNTPISQDKIANSVSKLISFLKAHQDADGKILDGGTSDWAAMAFGANGIYASDVKSGDKSLYDFISTYNFTDASDLNLCASYPRHLLALLAAGTSVSDSKIIDLKNKIDNQCVNGSQYGQNGTNDDVFGLIALLAAGQDQSSPAVQAALNGIKNDQQTDGSFTWSGYSGADITGASIDALKYAQSQGVNIDQNIFTKAKQYLKAQQLADGGWGFGSSDALTTGWAMMGINALNEDQTNWYNSAGKNPWYILTTLDTDHFTQSWDSNVDWFGTKHAIPALLGKFWPIILNPKTTTSVGGSTVSPATTSTTIAIATTTITISTTTPATSTVFTSTTTTDTTTTEPVLETIAQAIQTPIVNHTNSGKVLGEKIVAQNFSPSTTPLEISDASTTPLDTPTKNMVKKILAISGGSAVAVGAWLGLRLLKNVL